ncbi:MAG: DUF1499 domain-containing protein [Gemmatimonadetes bacterium]|nr:DUF1499 domain-containing protein [Gemmatimonadota bacterium]
MRKTEMTQPGHADPTLRGRRYAIPFDTVWKRAVALIAEGGSRWTLQEADDQRGIIRAEVRTFLLGFVDDLRIRVWLDVDAQTRVDVLSRCRTSRPDFGANAKRIRRYLRNLDRTLDPPPAAILPPEGGLMLAHEHSR